MFLWQTGTKNSAQGLSKNLVRLVADCYKQQQVVHSYQSLEAGQGLDNGWGIFHTRGWRVDGEWLLVRLRIVLWEHHEIVLHNIWILKWYSHVLISGAVTWERLTWERLIWSRDEWVTKIIARLLLI